MSRWFLVSWLYWWRWRFVENVFTEYVFTQLTWAQIPLWKLDFDWVPQLGAFQVRAASFSAAFLQRNHKAHKGSLCLLWVEFEVYGNQNVQNAKCNDTNHLRMKFWIWLNLKSASGIGVGNMCIYDTVIKKNLMNKLMYPGPVSVQCKLAQLVTWPRQQIWSKILSSKCVYVDIFETFMTKMPCRAVFHRTEDWGLRTEDSLTHTEDTPGLGPHKFCS